MFAGSRPLGSPSSAAVGFDAREAPVVQAGVFDCAGVDVPAGGGFKIRASCVGHPATVCSAAEDVLGTDLVCMAAMAAVCPVDTDPFTCVWHALLTEGCVHCCFALARVQLDGLRASCGAFARCFFAARAASIRSFRSAIIDCSTRQAASAAIVSLKKPSASKLW